MLRVRKWKVEERKKGERLRKKDIVGEGRGCGRVRESRWSRRG